MTNKQRLQKLRTECTDWEQIVRKFELLGGIAPRDVELAILALIDAGLVRIERRPGRPTAFVLTIPDGIPQEILDHVAEE
jgi:hypothetical protein